MWERLILFVAVSEKVLANCLDCGVAWDFLPTAC